MGNKMTECSSIIPLVPTYTATIGYIQSICSGMQMEGCNKPECADFGDNCDVLGVYSLLCQQMPDMTQCSTWQIMCETVPEVSL